MNESQVLMHPSLKLNLCKFPAEYVTTLYKLYYQESPKLIHKYGWCYFMIITGGEQQHLLPFHFIYMFENHYYIPVVYCYRFQEFILHSEVMGFG